MNALLENGFNVADLTYKSFLYYKSDCSLEEPWTDKMTEYEQLINEGLDVAQFVLTRINELGDVNLMNTCGRDFMPIIQEVDETQMNLMLLLNNMDDAVQLSSCERVEPIYDG